MDTQERLNKIRRLVADIYHNYGLTDVDDEKQF